MRIGDKNMATLETLRNELNEAEARHDELFNIHQVEIESGKTCEQMDFSEDYKIDRRIKELKIVIKIEERREVKVGDGVTVCYYSDCKAYTVIKRTKATITIQRDKATLDPSFKPEFIAGGFVGHCVNQSEQTYTYERDENGTIQTARWSERDGMFKVNGCLKVYNGRHEFYDYNF